MKHIHFSALIAICGTGIAFISACAELPNSSGSADRKQVLEQLNGPKLTSMEETLKISAEQSTKSGDYKRAGQFYKQLTDQYPDKREYTIGLAENHRRTGKYDEALRIFTALLDKEPNNVDALEGKALTLMAMGDTAESGKLFDKVMSIDPKRWRTLNAAGILFANRGMVDESMAYYEQAITVNPNNAAVLNNVGLTLALDKQYDNAIESLQRAIRLAPAESKERAQLDMNLALIYALSGNMAMAENTAGKHLSGAHLLNNLGLYAHLAKDDVLAKSYLNMALTKNSLSYERAWNNLDFISKLGTDKDQAKKDKSVIVRSGTPTPLEKKVEKPVSKETPSTEAVKNNSPEPGESDKKPEEKEAGQQESDKQSE